MKFKDTNIKCESGVNCLMFKGVGRALSVITELRYLRCSQRYSLVR